MSFILKLIAKKAHKRLYGRRCECNIGLKYFYHTDFPGLKRDNIEFKSHFNDTLRGGIYYRDNYRKDVLCVFIHGNTSIHNSYTKEINYLCEHGFRVLSYDVTGTNLSDGNILRGFYQFPSDLNACLDFIASHDEFKKLDVYLVGHSMGGYSVLHSMAFKNNQQVKKIVSLSGLRSMQSTFKEHSPKKYHKAVRYLVDIEEKIYGKNVYFDAVDYIGNTNIETLLIHSMDDHVVNYKNNFIKMVNNIEGNEKVHTITVDNHFHNPTYKEESVKALVEYLNILFTLKKDSDKIALRDKTDFNVLCTLDEKIMHEIINFLSN